jgi:hypothetical protein
MRQTGMNELVGVTKTFAKPTSKVHETLAIKHDNGRPNEEKDLANRIKTSLFAKISESRSAGTNAT